MKRGWNGAGRTTQLRVYISGEMSYESENTGSRHELFMDRENRERACRRVLACPACGKETAYEGNPYRPFCSRGCKGLDLIHWASESYRIEGSTQEDRADNEPD